jgi:hypothetical protein
VEDGPSELPFLLISRRLIFQLFVLGELETLGFGQSTYADIVVENQKGFHNWKAHVVADDECMLELLAAQFQVLIFI